MTICSLKINIYHIFLKFVYLFMEEGGRERERQTDRQTDRQTQNPKQASHCQHEARWGDHDLS